MTSSYFQAQTGVVAEQSAPIRTSAVARWHWVQTKILHHPDLSTAEVCVAIVLASHVNDRTRACFPKIETIASETKLSDRKVRQALKRLVELGLVAKLSRAVGRLRNRNAYKLISLGSKPESDSTIPASDSGVKPAHNAGFNKKNTDKEENTDETEQVNPVAGAGATILPAIDDQYLILAKEWQRLCCEPWTLANACLRVNEAIGRAGIDAVRLELARLRQKAQRPNRLAIVDLLDGLVMRGSSDNSKVTDFAAQSKFSGPAEWQEICSKVACLDIPGCRHPRIWLSQLMGTIDGKKLQLVAKNRCVQDKARNHLAETIEIVAKSLGLEMGVVTCLR